MDKHFVIVPDGEEGHTVYEIGYGEDPFKDGVPIYRTDDTRAVDTPGTHKWLVNYAKAELGVSPDWKGILKVETTILKKANSENLPRIQELRLQDMGKRQTPPASPTPKKTKLCE